MCVRNFTYVGTLSPIATAFSYFPSYGLRCAHLICIDWTKFIRANTFYWRRFVIYRIASYLILFQQIYRAHKYTKSCWDYFIQFRSANLIAIQLLIENYGTLQDKQFSAAARLLCQHLIHQRKIEIVHSLRTMMNDYVQPCLRSDAFNGELQYIFEMVCDASIRK